MSRFLKPYTLPDGFVVVVDTREQLPLFGSVNNLTQDRRKLDKGDYSIQGFEDMICVERKMISDLTSYMTTERDRTVTKLEAMEDMKWKALVVECEEAELYIPKVFTNVPPEVFRQTLASWRVRYNLHVYCSRRREWIERYILDHFIKFYRIVREI